jgi:hypothetical protein
VRLFFLLAALNDLDALACDIQNAYIHAATKERIWFHGGDEMGFDKGKVIGIVHVLYGLKSSGVRWREHMSQTLQNGGFTSCKADPNLWLKPATKPDGSKIYEYVLCYVDDCIFQGLDPPGFMDYLRTVYTMKDGSLLYKSRRHTLVLTLEGTNSPMSKRLGRFPLTPMCDVLSKRWSVSLQNLASS